MKTKLVLYLASIFLLAALAPTGGKARTIKVKSDIMVDEAGRVVMLRGVNAGGRSKFPPFFPFDPGDDFEAALEVYADAVADMGFNVVRLLIIYEAAEPVRGEYDQAYLDRYDLMVRAFAGRGILVVIDGHQDLYSRRFHGDGFPDWTLPEKYRGREQTHDRKVWNVGYFTRPVLVSLQRFWSNKDNIRDGHVEFYRYLAERYRDEPAVIGFEPFNEPMPGWKGYLDYRGFHRDLYEYYERVAAAVQGVDAGYLVFADICAIENTGTINAGRPRPKINNLVLAPHYYDLGTFGRSLSKGGDMPVMRAGIGRHLKLARHWNVPVIFTEYGVSPGFMEAPIYIDELYSIFDDEFISGTFWEASISGETWNHEDTSIFTPSGEVRKNAMPLCRPYPRRTAGIPLQLKYSREEGSFSYSYEPDHAIQSPTLIYLPPDLGKGEVTVTGAAWSYNEGSRVMAVQPDASGGNVTIEAIESGD